MLDLDPYLVPESDPEPERITVPVPLRQKATVPAVPVPAPAPQHFVFHIIFNDKCMSPRYTDTLYSL